MGLVPRFCSFSTIRQLPHVIAIFQVSMKEKLAGARARQFDERASEQRSVHWSSTNV